MAVALDPYRLSSPRIFLVRMLAFIILSGFVGLILYKQIVKAFMANPGLNGLILGVLVIGIILAFRQVIRLFREIRWVNEHRQPGELLHELFRQSAQRWPTKIAVRLAEPDPETSRRSELTYEELRQRASRFARLLRAKGVSAATGS